MRASASCAPVALACLAVLGLRTRAGADIPAGTCPGPERMKAIASVLSGGLMLACTPIRGRHSRAMLMGRVANPGKGRDWIYAMIDDTGTVLLDSRVAAKAADVDVAWSMVDLDGDGNDELIEQVSSPARIGIGIGRMRVNVYAIGDGAPVLGGSLAVSDTLGDHRNGCHGAFRYSSEAKHLLIEVESTTQADPKLAPAPATCPPSGRHRYRWDGAKLIEVPVVDPPPRPRPAP